MRTKKQAFLFVGIPFIVGVAIGIAFILATLLEFPTNRGSLYSSLAFFALLGSIFSPAPCCVLSILGTKRCIELKKQKEKLWILPFLIGIINIIVSVIVGVAWWYIIFIGGRGV